MDEWGGDEGGHDGFPDPALNRVAVAEGKGMDPEDAGGEDEELGRGGRGASCAGGVM